MKVHNHQHRNKILAKLRIAAQAQHKLDPKKDAIKCPSSMQESLWRKQHMPTVTEGITIGEKQHPWTLNSCIQAVKSQITQRALPRAH